MSWREFAKWREKTPGMLAVVIVMGEEEEVLVLMGEEGETEKGSNKDLGEGGGRATGLTLEMPHLRVEYGRRRRLVAGSWEGIRRGFVGRQPRRTRLWPR